MSVTLMVVNLLGFVVVGAIAVIKLGQLRRQLPQ